MMGLLGALGGAGGAGAAAGGSAAAGGTAAGLGAGAGAGAGAAAVPAAGAMGATGGMVGGLGANMTAASGAGSAAPAAAGSAGWGSSALQMMGDFGKGLWQGYTQPLNAMMHPGSQMATPTSQAQAYGQRLTQMRGQGGKQQMDLTPQVPNAADLLGIIQQLQANRRMMVPQ